MTFAVFPFWIIPIVLGAATIEQSCQSRQEQLQNGEIVNTPVCDKFRSWQDNRPTRRP